MDESKKNLSGLWNKKIASDFLFEEIIDEPKKRVIKLNNWIQRKTLPKNTMLKIGGEIFFNKEALVRWIRTEMQNVAN